MVVLVKGNLLLLYCYVLIRNRKRQQRNRQFDETRFPHSKGIKKEKRKE